MPTSDRTGGWVEGHSPPRDPCRLLTLPGKSGRVDYLASAFSTAPTQSAVTQAATRAKRRLQLSALIEPGRSRITVGTKDPLWRSESPWIIVNSDELIYFLGYIRHK